MGELPTYFARVLEEIHYSPGAWTGRRIGVFRREGVSETQVGEYERDYPALFRTFAPFRVGNRDLALYSPDYTVTRLLELPSCRDIGGEEPNSAGFCPVEFFVPYYIDLELRVAGRPPTRVRKQMPTPDDLRPRDVSWPPIPGGAPPKERLQVPIGPFSYHPFAFVAGCIWGDDSSWKLQYLDLSQAAGGIVQRDDRFGYVELPSDLPLDRAVDMEEYEGDNPGDDDAYQLRITHVTRFDVRDGQSRELHLRRDRDRPPNATI